MNWRNLECTECLPSMVSGFRQSMPRWRQLLFDAGLVIAEIADGKTRLSGHFLKKLEMSKMKKSLLNNYDFFILIWYGIVSADVVMVPSSRNINLGDTFKVGVNTSGLPVVDGTMVALSSTPSVVEVHGVALGDNSILVLFCYFVESIICFFYSHSLAIWRHACSKVVVYVVP